jgi:competence protein ComEA
MQFFTFTAQETKALIFLLAALAVGSGITLYKRSHPRFAPELVLQSTQSPPAQRVVDASDQAPGEKTLIDINRAAAKELDLLPGIGPALSRRVVEYRQINGPFAKIEDITRVQGIGPKIFQRIRDYISAGPDTAEVSP